MPLTEHRKTKLSICSKGTKNIKKTSKQLCGRYMPLTLQAEATLGEKVLR